MEAAAFVRLCVETDSYIDMLANPIAAAFVRLCVETLFSSDFELGYICSRLRAAVC